MKSESDQLRKAYELWQQGDELCTKALKDAAEGIELPPETRTELEHIRREMVAKVGRIEAFDGVDIPNWWPWIGGMIRDGYGLEQTCEAIAQHRRSDLIPWDDVQRHREAVADDIKRWIAELERDGESKHAEPPGGSKRRGRPSTIDRDLEWLDEYNNGNWSSQKEFAIYKARKEDIGANAVEKALERARNHIKKPAE